MNTAQRTVVVIALLVGAGMALVPPWLSNCAKPPAGVFSHADRHAFLFDPPSFQVATLTSGLLQFEGYQIDLPRLLVQWAAVAFTAAALLLILRRP